MWNIARSAEAMFTRWAVKRFCRFLLKKKLGKFIIGDIDLHQLDVQLVSGIIQLSDLALNVDYINEKLRSVSKLVIKEGSIGSLLVKMPWSGSGFEIEVDELEIVLTPSMEAFSPEDYRSLYCGEDNHGTKMKSQKHDQGTADFVSSSTLTHVHEGVKTVAKMLKWLFASFHIKIKRLIVALELLPADESMTGSNTALVLRVIETECKTYISEDTNFNGNGRDEGLVEVSQLMYIVRFRGLLFELIRADGIENTVCPSESGFLPGQWPSDCHPLNVSIPVISGESSGVSGELKISLPRKNGALNVRKVDCEMNIDHLKLKLQPTIIKWLLQASNWFRKFSEREMYSAHNEISDSVYFDPGSHFTSLAFDSSVTGNDNVVRSCESISKEPCFSSDREGCRDSTFLDSAVISNWVQVSADKIQMGKPKEDSDYGARLDHFFECIDEVRCSQAPTSNSGIWNWASSVFTAINLASSLDKGSVHVPIEQEMIEINANATVVGICVMFFFDDESACHMGDVHGQAGSSSVHFLDAKMQEVLLYLQVGPQEIEFQATTKSIEVSHHLSCASGDTNLGLTGSKTSAVQHLQEEVDGTLPSFCSSLKRSSAFNSNDLGGTDFSPSTLFYPDYRMDNVNCQSKDNVESVKVNLLSTSGITCLHCALKSDPSASSGADLISFKLELSPFRLWLDFNMVSLFMDFCKEVESSTEVSSLNDKNESTSIHNKHDALVRKDVKIGFHSTGAGLSSKGSVRGEIFISNARIIFCFPIKNHVGLQSYFSWDEFIVLSCYSQESPNRSVLRSDYSPVTSFQDRYSLDRTCLLCVPLSSFDVHLVTMHRRNATVHEPCALKKNTISSYPVFSVECASGTSSFISMVWQEAPIIDPYIERSGKTLASSGSTSRNHAKGNGYEFASACIATDTEDSKIYLNRETVKSSGFFLHVSLSPVTIRLDNLQYKAFYRLLDELSDVLSRRDHCRQGIMNDKTGCQMAYFVDCEAVEVLIRPDVAEGLENLRPCRLPGQWCSLKLKIQKFELRYISSLGCTDGANFFWVGHKEGELFGSLTEVPECEFLLITCSNSSVGRGNGGGSNSLSCGFAGFDMIQMWDPPFHDCWTSITFRCATIVGVGGRVDWLSVVSSFFSLGCSQTGKETNELQSNASFKLSFVLNLVDVGLSYEPYLGSSSTNDLPDMQKDPNKYAACLLAASFLILSNQSIEDSVNDNYNIKLLDLGMLLSLVPRAENVVKSFSVGDLQKNVYVKVAEEAFIEASLRVNCKNGLLWELECSDCHSSISLDTCSDTTDGLFGLFAQLQQLFVPDIDCTTHLQTRWNNTRHVRNDSGRRHVSNSIISCSSASCSGNSVVDTRGKSVANDLVDEVCIDAFHMVQKEDYVSPFYEPAYCILPGGNISADACKPSVSGTEVMNNCCQPKLPPHLPFAESSKHLDETSNFLCDNGTYLGNRSGRSGWYSGTSFNIVENHIFEASEQNNPVKLECVPFSRGRILLKNVNIRWRMFGGRDWDDSKMQYSNICQRDATSCLELALIGISFQYECFPDGQTSVSKFSFTVKDIFLSDNSKNAPWKMVLGHYESREHPRESSTDALKLDLEAFRPDPSIPLEEYRLKIAFLPLVLHLHQIQLDFLFNFFFGKPSLVQQSPSLSQEFDRSSECPHRICEEALLPYFQKFEIWPVTVRFDYTPSCVDFTALQGGKYTELVNLVSLKGVELHLKRVDGVGVYGWNGLCEAVMDEWIEDITQNQLHKLVQGFPMIRSLVAIGSGAVKLVSSPIKNYKKDRRLIKGLQRGTIAFLRSLSLEAVGLGLHLAAGAHDILLQAEYVLINGHGSTSMSGKHQIKNRAVYNQPQDAQHGFKQAYESLTDGIGRSASVLVQTPMKAYKKGGGPGSVLASAVWATPAAVIVPASAAADAVHCALLGVRNSLDPEHKKESMKKYSGPSHPLD